MKVKKSQCLMASLNTLHSQLCSCIIYMLLTICLLETIDLRMHVNAYMSNSLRHLSIHNFNESRKNVPTQRNGRFLFDSLFGIDTPQLDAADFDDDDDEDDEPAKPCKCGKQKNEY